MAEICHLENRHDVIFFCRGWSVCGLVQNDMSTAVMWSKSKSDVEFQYGGRLGEFSGMSSQSHLPHTAGCCHLANSMSWFQSYVSHCRVLPPGEFNGMSSQSHVARCMNHDHIAKCSHLAKSMSRSCHIAGCKNSIRHIENRFSSYFIFKRLTLR